MPAALDRSGAIPSDNQRNIARVVRVTLTHSRSIEQRRMIEQRTVAVCSGPHFVQQIRKLCDVIGVDLFDFCDLLGFAGVMSDGVMRIRNTDLRIGHAAELTAEHQSNWTREIALVSQYLQIA